MDIHHTHIYPSKRLISKSTQKQKPNFAKISISQMGFLQNKERSNLGGLGSTFGQPEPRGGRSGRGGSPVGANTSRRKQRGGRNGVGVSRLNDAVWRRWWWFLCSLRNIKTSVQAKSKLGFPPFASHLLGSGPFLFSNCLSLRSRKSQILKVRESWAH